ncbi:hypothetical protein JW877_07440 [bacterium]|nr:hypothetical protein [bacterium]
MRTIILIWIILSVAVTISAARIGEPFDSLTASEYLTFSPDSLDSVFFEALKDAGSNWRELAEFVKVQEDERVAAALLIVNTMPHLDRLVATEEILSEHFQYAYMIKKSAPYDVPDSLFRDYILTYRIASEPLEAYRKTLYERFYPIVGNITGVKKVCLELNKWIAENITVGEYEFFGEIQTPTLTLKRKEGTEREIAILTTAILKTFGIPSRNAYVPSLLNENEGASWVEYFAGDGWYPLYPREPEHLNNFKKFEDKYEQNITLVVTQGGFETNFATASYSKIGFLMIRFSRDGSPAKEFEHFSVCLFSDGTYIPLDAIGAEADSNGEFIAELGDGAYWVQTGVRDRTGSVFVQTYPFEITASETLFLDLDVSPQDYVDEANYRSGQIPAFNLPSGDGEYYSYNQFLNKPTIWVLFSAYGEPSIRMLPVINNLFTEYRDAVNFVGICQGDPGDNIERLVDYTLLIDLSSALGLQISRKGSLERLGNVLPIVLFTPLKSEKFDVLVEGYDLNIEELVRAKLNSLR